GSASLVKSSRVASSPKEGGKTLAGLPVRAKPPSRGAGPPAAASSISLCETGWISLCDTGSVARRGRWRPFARGRMPWRGRSSSTRRKVDARSLGTGTPSVRLGRGFGGLPHRARLGWGLGGLPHRDRLGWGLGGLPHRDRLGRGFGGLPHRDRLGRGCGGRGFGGDGLRRGRQGW